MQTPKGVIDDSIILLLQNEEILAKISEAMSPEECYDIVKDKVTVNYEEFVEMMAIGKSYMDETQEGLLSENDLDAIAGGKLDINASVALGAVGAAVVYTELSAASS